MQNHRALFHFSKMPSILLLTLKNLSSLARFIQTLKFFFCTFTLFLVTESGLFAQKFTPTPSPEFDSLILKAYSLRFVNWDSAMILINQAQKFPSLNPLQETMIANQLGSLYYIKGDYPQSLRFYSEALQLLEKTPDLPQEALALNGRGLIHLSQDEFEKAAEIFEKCVQINYSIGDTGRVAASYFNKGIALDELQKYNLALEALEKAISISESQPDLQIRFMSYNRQGQIKLEQGDIEEAKRLFSKALYENPNPNNWEQTFANTGLGLIALRENQLQEAVQFGQKAYESAKLVKAFWDKERATRLLSEAHEKLGDYQKALEFSRLNKSYADSLYNQEKNAEVSYLQLKLAQADNVALEQAKQLSDQRAKVGNRTVLGLSIILTLLLIALVIYRKGLKQKENLNAQLLEKQKEIIQQNEKLNRLNEEKNKLFSIISHDLKTPINSIRQILELQSMGILNPEEKAKTDEMLIKQVEHTDQMMDQLLQWAHAQMSGIITHKSPVEVNALIEKIIGQNLFIASKKEIQFDFVPAQPSLQILADKVQLQIIFQNCIQNALKFSHVGEKIHITTQDVGNQIQVLIQDRGVGIAQNKLEEIQQKQNIVASSEGTKKEQGTGLGLLLVKQFVEMNQGKIQIDSFLGKGTTITLTFDKAV